MRFLSYISLIALFSCQQAKNTFDTSSSGDSNSGSNESTVNNVKLAPKDYVQWNENPENGMIIEKTIGDFSFSSFYETPEYLALKEFGDTQFTKKEYEEKLMEYDGMEYFSFRIQSLSNTEELLKVGIKSDDEYYARIEYFSFKMQKDFKMIEGNDTLDCKLFHFERVYGLAPKATFIMGFSSDKKSVQSA
jgi:hypothetical protein